VGVGSAYPADVEVDIENRSAWPEPFDAGKLLAAALHDNRHRTPPSCDLSAAGEKDGTWYFIAGLQAKATMVTRVRQRPKG